MTKKREKLMELRIYLPQKLVLGYDNLSKILSKKYKINLTRNVLFTHALMHYTKYLSSKGNKKLYDFFVEIQKAVDEDKTTH